MKQEYVITEKELAEKGLNLNDYALEGTLIPAIINLGLDLTITRASALNDDVKGETKIEEWLDNNQDKIGAFKKLQYRVIYNLIFQGETSPTDKFADDIIVHELRIGRINGTQFGIFNEPRR